MTYDSTAATLEHIAKVRTRMGEMAGNLRGRALVHDNSKLLPPEKKAFDLATPNLHGLTYGSPEYEAARAEINMDGALAHHYRKNSHHPEHYADGVNGMSLLDCLEMLADWKAAGERHANGSLSESLKVNKERFGISDQMQSILVNTARELGWLE